MLQEVIYYIVTMILTTKELVIATDQCTEYQFKSPFFPGVSCENIYNKNPESHDRSGYYWITDGPSRVYCGMNYTGSSCEDIYNNNLEVCDKPGYYHINESQWTFCNMTATNNGDAICTCAGVGGGWRRIANVNINAGDDCPGVWRKATQSGVSFCRVASDGLFVCSSAYFSTNGISYQRVCGELEDIREEILVQFMVFLIAEQLMKTMFLDYRSLTVAILVSIFGLLLVAMVKELMLYGVALVLVLMHTLLLHLLAVTIIIVNQILVILTHTISMTHYGMEQDVWIIVVVTPHNLCSIVNRIRPHKMTLKHEYVHMVILYGALIDQLELYEQ